MIVTSGGIGGNHDLVRAQLADRAARHPRRRRWSPASPRTSTAGCSRSPRTPAASVINRDRMWHYTEGIQNWDPIWPNHGIRILPGPSSLWLDATGERLPGAVPARASTPSARSKQILRDRLRLLLVRAHPEDHREGVRALRLGAEPRPHRQGHQAAAQARSGQGAPGPVEAFKQHGEDFVVADNLADLVAGMNEIAGARRSITEQSQRADRRPRPRSSTTRTPRTPRSPGIRNARATTAATS